jgi:Zn-dependent M28 family amino/carboxypeptidase
VGAHLDAWETGNGAHDDGAGCAQVIEAMRLLRAAGLRPKRTIRGVLFMNEENGLAGGKAYLAAHKNETHVFAIETDSGGFAPRAFTAPASSDVFAAVQAAAALLAPIGAIAVRDGGGGADLSPMQAAKIPCGQLLVDGTHYFDFHHSENDVLAAVDPWDLENDAAALACVLWLVADR